MTVRGPRRSVAGLRLKDRENPKEASGSPTASHRTGRDDARLSRKLASGNDPPAAADQWEKIFDGASEKGYCVGAAHISIPGLGLVRRDVKGHAWITATYRGTD
jgi:hypothetical protein